MQIKTKIVNCHTADSKPVKQEVKGTVILPPLVFPGQRLSPEVRIQGRAARVPAPVDHCPAISVGRIAVIR